MQQSYYDITQYDQTIPYTMAMSDLILYILLIRESSFACSM